MLKRSFFFLSLAAVVPGVAQTSPIDPGAGVSLDRGALVGADDVEVRSGIVRIDGADSVRHRLRRS